MCCLARCWEWGPLGVVWALANVSCNNHFFHLVKKRLNKRYPFFLTSQKSSNKEYHDVKNLPNKKKFHTSAHQPALHFLYWASCPRSVHVFGISGLVICSCFFELFSPGRCIFHIWFIGCNVYHNIIISYHSSPFFPFLARKYTMPCGK